MIEICDRRIKVHLNCFDNIRATTGRFPCRFEEEHILALDPFFHKKVKLIVKL